MLFRVAGAAIALACATPAAAQIGFEANGSRAEDRWGAELGVGYAIKAGGFSVTPTLGAFVYKSDNDRYFLDNNGGNPRCRDRTNGQYADSANCNDAAIKPYARIEASYTTSSGLMLGAGARVDDDERIRPYGTLAVRLGPRIQLKGNAGPHYYAAGIRFGF